MKTILLKDKETVTKHPAARLIGISIELVPVSDGKGKVSGQSLTPTLAILDEKGIGVNSDSDPLPDWTAYPALKQLVESLEDEILKILVTRPRFKGRVKEKS